MLTFMGAGGSRVLYDASVLPEDDEKVMTIVYASNQAQTGKAERPKFSRSREPTGKRGWTKLYLLVIGGLQIISLYLRWYGTSRQFSQDDILRVGGMG